MTYEQESNMYDLKGKNVILKARISGIWTYSGKVVRESNHSLCIIDNHSGNFMAFTKNQLLSVESKDND